MEEVELDCNHDNLSQKKKFSYETFETAANIFRVLGDIERLKIMSLLAEKELCVSEIAAISEEEISTVSQRLKVLKNEKVIKQRRDGKHIYYKLADDHIINVINNVLTHVEE